MLSTSFTVALLTLGLIHCQSIRGTPGVDYPNYSEIPKTEFQCSEQLSPGFYADPDTRCQVFHYCYEHRRESFLCPPGTIFNQAILACDYWYSAKCSSTNSYYHVNDNEEHYNEAIPVGIVYDTIDYKSGDLFEKIATLYNEGNESLHLKDSLHEVERNAIADYGNATVSNQTNGSIDITLQKTEYESYDDVKEGQEIKIPTPENINIFDMFGSISMKDKREFYKHGTDDIDVDSDDIEGSGEDEYSEKFVINSEPDRMPYEVETHDDEISVNEMRATHESMNEYDPNEFYHEIYDEQFSSVSTDENTRHNFHQGVVHMQEQSLQNDDQDYKLIPENVHKYSDSHKTIDPREYGDSHYLEISNKLHDPGSHHDLLDYAKDIDELQGSYFTHEPELVSKYDKTTLSYEFHEGKPSYSYPNEDLTHAYHETEQINDNYAEEQADFYYELGTTDQYPEAETVKVNHEIKSTRQYLESKPTIFREVDASTFYEEVPTEYNVVELSNELHETQTNNEYIETESNNEYNKANQNHEHNTEKPNEYHDTEENKYQKSRQNEYSEAKHNQYHEAEPNEHNEAGTNKHHAAGANEYHDDGANEYHEEETNDYHEADTDKYYGVRNNEYHGLENKYHETVTIKYHEVDENEYYVADEKGTNEYYEAEMNENHEARSKNYYEVEQNHEYNEVELNNEYPEIEIDLKNHGYYYTEPPQENKAEQLIETEPDVYPKPDLAHELHETEFVQAFRILNNTDESNHSIPFADKEMQSATELKPKLQGKYLVPSNLFDHGMDEVLVNNEVVKESIPSDEDFYFEGSGNVEEEDLEYYPKFPKTDKISRRGNRLPLRKPEYLEIDTTTEIFHLPTIRSKRRRDYFKAAIVQAQEPTEIPTITEDNSSTFASTISTNMKDTSHDLHTDSYLDTITNTLENDILDNHIKFESSKGNRTQDDSTARNETNENSENIRDLNKSNNFNLNYSTYDEHKNIETFTERPKTHEVFTEYIDHIVSTQSESSALNNQYRNKPESEDEYFAEDEANMVENSYVEEDSGNEEEYVQTDYEDYASSDPSFKELDIENDFTYSDGEYVSVAEDDSIHSENVHSEDYETDNDGQFVDMVGQLEVQKRPNRPKLHYSDYEINENMYKIVPAQQESLFDVYETENKIQNGNVNEYDEKTAAVEQNILQKSDISPLNVPEDIGVQNAIMSNDNMDKNVEKDFVEFPHVNMHSSQPTSNLVDTVNPADEFKVSNKIHINKQTVSIKNAKLPERPTVPNFRSFFADSSMGFRSNLASLDRVDAPIPTFNSVFSVKTGKAIKSKKVSKLLWVGKYLLSMKRAKLDALKEFIPM